MERILLVIDLLRMIDDIVARCNQVQPAESPSK